MPFRSASEISVLQRRYRASKRSTKILQQHKQFTFLLFLLQEVTSVYRILSAILNTGNIEFAAITSQHQTDKSEVPNSESLENGKIQHIKVVSVITILFFSVKENCLSCQSLRHQPSETQANPIRLKVKFQSWS